MTNFSGKGETKMQRKCLTTQLHRCVVMASSVKSGKVGTNILFQFYTTPANAAEFRWKLMGPFCVTTIYLYFKFYVAFSDRGSDRASDRASDRGSDRASDRSIERPSERPSERSIERASDRESERSREGTSDRATEDDHNVSS